MADFKLKLFALASVASAFAGMAYGQTTCNSGAAIAPVANAVFIRAEGKTEQVADLTITCDKVASNGGPLSVTVFLSPSVSITSANVGSSPKSEATALSTGQAGAPAANLAIQAQGTVSGNSVVFNLASTPIAAAGTFTITVTNIKIDATQLPASTGVPTAITETIFVGGAGVVPAVLSTTPAVAFVTNGIGGIKSTLSTDPSKGPGSNSICQSIFSATGNFNVVFGEGFGNSFKLQGSAAGNAAPNSWFTNNTETGYGYAPTGGTNTATTGTRVKIVFNNIPANITFYVPVAVTATAPGTGQMVLTASETGAFSAVAGSTANGAPGAPDTKTAGSGTGAALTVSNGSATAIYEYRGVGGLAAASDSTQESFATLVSMVASSGAVPAPAGAITATVSFAPIGASANVPNFVSGASTATVNGSNFTACSTTLLFPFVTNQLGFDTGLAIANTSSDLLNGGTKSTAAAASGTCSLTFFGSGAPAAAVPTPSVTTGTTYAATASSLAPGFQGYAIASCNFLYAHGFAFVSLNLGSNTGAAMGYLADVLTSDRKSVISTGAAGGAVGTTSVSSTTPER